MLTRARLLCELVLCVSRAVLSVVNVNVNVNVVLGAWSVRFVGWADWVDCWCFLSFVFLGVARRLERSPCNTRLRGISGHVLNLCALHLIKKMATHTSASSAQRAPG